MLHATIQLILYGFLAGLSPLALGATIAVMQTGRVRTLGFGVGFVVGQLLTCVLLVALGVAGTGSSRSYPGVQAGLELLVAAALIVLAVRVRRRGPVVRPESGERARRLLDRLGRVHLVTVSLVGLLLGIGGPKRLLLTAFAAATITAAGLPHAAQAGLVVLYVALASVLVWGPVLLQLFLGRRAVGIMQSLQARLAPRSKELTVYALLVLAAMLVLDAILTVVD
jgi:hypothetical protein